METKTVCKGLNYVDEVILDGINNVKTSAEIEHLHNFMIENRGDNTEIISCINQTIESYYFIRKKYNFESHHRPLRRLNMECLHKCKSPFDNNSDED